MSGRRPDVTLRDGAISLSAWSEPGQNGKTWWKSIRLQRSYEKVKGSGDWSHGDIGGRDVPAAIQLLTAFHLKHGITEPQQAGSTTVTTTTPDDIPY